MNKKANFCYTLLILSSFTKVIGQATLSFPDHFDQFFNNYYLLNPANADSSYKIAIRLSDKAQTGLFRGINKLYVDGDLKLPSRNENFQFIGFQVINNKEGEFINKSRVCGRYSWRTRISQNASLSAGISLGLVNYAYNTSQSGAGGSAWAPDGNAGIWYLRQKFSLGFSLQQMFRREIRPVNQSFTLERYYNLTSFYTIGVSPFFNIDLHFYSRFQLAQPFYYNIIMLGEWQEKVQAGVGYRHQQGLSYIAGIQEIRLGDSRFSVYFSYFTRTKLFALNDNAIELLISFKK